MKLSMHSQAILVASLSLFTLSCSLPHALPNPSENPVNVVSDSVSPISANDAGNSNSNTGVLNGNSLKGRDSPADTVSDSLSPVSANAAGNDNKNTGTLDGNSVDVDPTINVARKLI